MHLISKHSTKELVSKILLWVPVFDKSISNLGHAQAVILVSDYISGFQDIPSVWWHLQHNDLCTWCISPLAIRVHRTPQQTRPGAREQSILQNAKHAPNLYQYAPVLPNFFYSQMNYPAGEEWRAFQAPSDGFSRSSQLHLFFTSFSLWGCI